MTASSPCAKRTRTSLNIKTSNSNALFPAMIQSLYSHTPYKKSEDCFSFMLSLVYRVFPTQKQSVCLYFGQYNVLWRRSNFQRYDFIMFQQPFNKPAKKCEHKNYVKLYLPTQVLQIMFIILFEFVENVIYQLCFCI